MHVIDAGVIWNDKTHELMVGNWEKIRHLTQEYPKSIQFNQRKNFIDSNDNFSIHVMYNTFIELLDKYKFPATKLHESFSVIDEYNANASGYLRNLPIEEEHHEAS